jgi:hypothetical protein
MTKDFLEACLKVAIYTRKADTKTSYYRTSGDAILPSRLDISLNAIFSATQHKGRMLTEKPVGEVRGQFKVLEESPLKQHTPFKISSKIFRQVEFPQLIGWAGIAISGEGNRIAKREVGVAVFVDLGDDDVKVYFFTGITSLPNNVKAVCGYVSEAIENGGGATPPPSGFKNGH